MAQPLHVPLKPSTDSLLRRKIYQFTMSHFFNQVIVNFVKIFLNNLAICIFIKKYTFSKLQIFAVFVILNSATLILPWDIAEENEKNQLLFFATALSAVINCLFTVEVII